jgi:hypothetical protein
MFKTRPHLRVHLEENLQILHHGLRSLTPLTLVDLTMVTVRKIQRLDRTSRLGWTNMENHYKNMEKLLFIMIIIQFD